jgi:hypothetical protein
MQLQKTSLRFGAHPPNITLGANLDTPAFQTAMDLTQAKTTHADRITRIADQKDPLHIEFKVFNHETTATIMAMYNRGKAFTKEATQTAADFFETVIKTAEAMAPKLLSKKEKDARELQAARDFIAPIKAAVLGNTYQIRLLKSENYGPQYKGTLCGATFELQVGEKIYHVSKHKRWNKYDYSISDEVSDAHSYYQFVNLYPTGKSDTSQPYFYYRLRDFAKEEDISISTEDHELRKALQPMKEDHHDIIKHLEAAGQLVIPNEH